MPDGSARRSGEILQTVRDAIGADGAPLYYVADESEPTTVLMVTRASARVTILAPIDSLAASIERDRALLESGDDARAESASLARALSDDGFDGPDVVPRHVWW